jgi:ketosteroid isomerase-like protein
MQRSPELADTLRAIYDAVSNGDEATLTGLLSARDGLVFIGTDPDEWFDDPDAIRRMLGAQAAAGVKVQSGSIQAYEEGTVGWVADAGTFLLPDGSTAPFRITCVFHREAGGWKLVQQHASVAVANEEVLGTDL